jgi:hypothetical protein
MNPPPLFCHAAHRALACRCEYGLIAFGAAVNEKFLDSLSIVLTDLAPHRWIVVQAHYGMREVCEVVEFGDVTGFARP